MSGTEVGFVRSHVMEHQYLRKLLNLGLAGVGALQVAGWYLSCSPGAYVMVSCFEAHMTVKYPTVMQSFMVRYDNSNTFLMKPGDFLVTDTFVLHKQATSIITTMCVCVCVNASRLMCWRIVM